MPAKTIKLLEYLKSEGIPFEKLAGHFHDTYGQALANIWVAYQHGIRAFDSSVGGLGGCPYAPGAKGNVASEDVVYMFEQAGVQTGVDLAQLATTGAWISGQLKKKNDSRAGSAVVAKSAKSAKAIEGTKEHDSAQLLNWLPQQAVAAEGLQFFRSGTNVKVVLNRPRNGNALTTAMITGLSGLMERLAQDQTVTRVVITANGKFFCTGMDLGKSSSTVSQDEATIEAQFNRLTKLFDLITNAPQVTIACLQGPAFGGGVGLAFSCDIRIISEKASITFSEVKLGLCPATISKVVIRELGVAYAREAMLSGRTISAEEISRIPGAVTKLVSVSSYSKDTSLMGVLDGYLATLKNAAPNASRMVKDLTKLAWQDDAGDSKQNQGIRKLFLDMMNSDNPEAEFGLREFQRGNKKVDWDAYALKRRTLNAKL